MPPMPMSSEPEAVKELEAVFMSRRLNLSIMVRSSRVVDKFLQQWVNQALDLTMMERFTIGLVSNALVRFSVIFCTGVFL